MTRFLRCAIPICLAVCVVPAQASETDRVAALAWMTGGWGSQQDGAWVEEHWSAPRGGTMLGTNRSGDKDAAKAFEFLRITAGADGVPVYWAAPGGRAATPFRLIESGSDWALFENATNSYPTGIRYRRSGDTLVATIEGPGGARPMSWTWHRLPVRR